MILGTLITFLKIENNNHKIHSDFNQEWGGQHSRFLQCFLWRKKGECLREAPLRLASPLFGHCPNSDCNPPPPHSGALFFRADLSKFAKSPFWRYISAQSILASLNTLLNTSKCPFEWGFPNVQWWWSLWIWRRKVWIFNTGNNKRKFISLSNSS